MLTLEKLNTYRAFGGDVDGFARSRRGADKSGITDDDWYLIGELLSALYLVASGKASSQFAAAVQRRIDDATTDEQTREELQKMSVMKWR